MSNLEEWIFFDKVQRVTGKTFIYIGGCAKVMCNIFLSQWMFFSLWLLDFRNWSAVLDWELGLIILFFELFLENNCFKPVFSCHFHLFAFFSVSIKIFSVSFIVSRGILVAFIGLFWDAIIKIKFFISLKEIGSREANDMKTMLISVPYTYIKTGKWKK